MLWRLFQTLFFFLLLTGWLLVCILYNLIKTILWKPSAMWTFISTDQDNSFWNIIGGYKELGECFIHGFDGIA